MRIAKAIVAAVGAVCTVLTAAFADDVFQASETATVLATVVESAVMIWAVYRVPNQGSA